MPTAHDPKNGQFATGAGGGTGNKASSLSNSTLAKAKPAKPKVDAPEYDHDRDPKLLSWLENKKGSIQSGDEIADKDGKMLKVKELNRDYGSTAYKTSAGHFIEHADVRAHRPGKQAKDGGPGSGPHPGGGGGSKQWKPGEVDNSGPVDLGPLPKFTSTPLHERRMPGYDPKKDQTKLRPLRERVAKDSAKWEGRVIDEGPTSPVIGDAAPCGSWPGRVV